VKRIWAPWRMQYILGKTSKGCIFCHEVKRGKEKENLILHKNRFTLVMMNKFPYTCGHLLIAPKKHTADLNTLSDVEIFNLIMTMKESVKLLSEVMKPQGFNLGMNLGRIAGAGIHDHLHLHIVPRWRGDTNFMPIITNSVVVSESLSDTYDRLYTVFKKLRR